MGIGIGDRDWGEMMRDNEDDDENEGREMGGGRVALMVARFARCIYPWFLGHGHGGKYWCLESDVYPVRRTRSTSAGRRLLLKLAS